ncbi:MAG: PilZ domain-containing protein [Verrucomicrobiales bacterium]|nr:PilZ domain-containing protein [Verrucomicrobiales bacterium]MCP5528680.1 PilZ domain-containing protein [Verrucomicrobiales bacterium]
MTTSKVDTSGVFDRPATGCGEARFLLPTHQVAFRKSGIEFLSHEAVPLWKEVTVELQSPVDRQPLEATGVVVDCTGNRHTGYVVSLIFLEMTPGCERRLARWAESATA